MRNMRHVRLDTSISTRVQFIVMNLCCSSRSTEIKYLNVLLSLVIDDWLQTFRVLNIRTFAFEVIFSTSLQLPICTFQLCAHSTVHIDCVLLVLCTILCTKYLVHSSVCTLCCAPFADIAM